MDRKYYLRSIWAEFPDELKSQRVPERVSSLKETEVRGQKLERSSRKGKMDSIFELQKYTGFESFILLQNVSRESGKSEGTWEGVHTGFHRA